VDAGRGRLAIEGKEMSDKTGASRPSRSGPGVILTGLAVGALLGTPVAASAAPAEAPAATDSVATCNQPSVVTETPATAIREQFRRSFTAGAVAPPATDLGAIICETN
jgi:hypothetical protein